MAGVEGIEWGSRLDSPNFAENDPVRSPAEGRLQKIIEGDVGLERIGLAFGRHNVRLLDVKFGSIFNDHDAIMLRNEVRQYPQKRRLATPAHPENQGVGYVAGMQVEIGWRAVVGFEHGQIFSAEMWVCLFARQDRKQKRKIGVVRVQQIQL